jgi:dipeptidyl aminopeptidase/acylaminoacyl peptidase
MGWSYGGFMISWVIMQTKRFKAAFIGAAVTNLMSFTGTRSFLGTSWMVTASIQREVLQDEVDIRIS